VHDRGGDDEVATSVVLRLNFYLLTNTGFFSTLHVLWIFPTVTPRVLNETYDTETRPRRQCHQTETRRSKQRLETFKSWLRSCRLLCHWLVTSIVC